MTQLVDYNDSGDPDAGALEELAAMQSGYVKQTKLFVSRGTSRYDTAS